MLSKAIYNEIKEGLKSELYKTIRLVRIDPDGSHEYIIGFNTIRKANLDKTIARLDHFKKLLDSKLEPGKYIIQAKGNLIHTRIDDFPVQVFEKKVTVISDNNNNSVQEKIDEFELQDEEFMDVEEYKKLLRDNATLHGQVRMLEIERDWFKQQLDYKEKDKGLADKSSGLNVLADLAKETIPGIVNLAEKFLKVREMEATQKQSLNDGKVKIKKAPPAKVNPQNAIDYYYNLLETNPDLANQHLDILEKQDPRLYEIVTNAIWPEGMEDEGEEEEEGQEGEEAEEGEEFDESEEEEEEEENN